MPGLSNSDISRTSGYQLQKGAPVNNAATLPQRVAVFAEMNTANQSTPLTPVQITSRAQAAALYGWGSPMDIIFRMLLPANGGGLDGVQAWAYPQAAAGGSAANSQSITVTGTATANVTHTLLIGGRAFLEGGSYAINITSGMTATQVATLIKNTINAVLGCPVTATSASGVVTTLANWTGLTSEDITINVLTNGVAAGMAYAIAEVAAGSGTPSIAAALALFANDWNTIVIDSYGILNTATNTLAVNFNGNPNTQTGQWAAQNMRPAIYIAGSVLDSTTTSADTVITAALLNELTMACGPAPLSLNLPMEVAAAYALLFANQANNSTNTDIEGMPLLDINGPLPGSANPIQSNNYTLRNALVQKGMSTIIYNNGQYFVQDFVTTYAPTGDPQPVWRYCRDIAIDCNIKYKFKQMQKTVIENKQIAADNDIVNAPNVVKPKDIRAALVALAKECVDEGLMTNAAYMISTISVVVNPSNVNRFDISFSYDRSGVVRVISNVVTVYP